MRWSKCLVAVVLVFHIVYLGYVVVARLPHVIWDGRFDLTVHVISPEGIPKRFTCEVHIDRQDAEYAVEAGGVPEVRWRGFHADPYDVSPFTIPIPVSGKDSLTGRQLERTQFQFLAVFARMADGRRVTKVVEIPDGRKTQDLYISLP